MNAAKKMVILDRDGVINVDSPDYIKSPDEWQAIPGSLAAIADLNRAGYWVTVATNQSGVGRGYYDLSVLKAIHQKMEDELAIVGGHLEGIYFCPHVPDDGCNCRKPKAGMLLQMAKDFNINLNEAVFIGDSLRDLEAGDAVNCPVIFLHNNQKILNLDANTPSFVNLAAAVHYLLK